MASPRKQPRHPGETGGKNRKTRTAKQTYAVLRTKRREFIDLALTAIHTVLAVTNRHGMVFYVNPAVKRLLGFEPESLMGRSCLELLEPGDRRRIARLWSRFVLSSRPSYTTDVNLRHRDGTLRIGRVRISRPDSRAKGAWFLLAVDDITARKASEEAHRHVSQTLNTLVQSLPAGIILTDPRGTIVLLNRMARQMLGWSESQTVQSYLSDPRHKAFKHVFDSAQNETQIHEEEIRVIADDGAALDISTSTAVLRNARGGISGHIFILNDVTQRRRTENIHRVTARELDTIFNAMADGVFLTDLEGRILRANQAISHILASPDGRLAGRTCSSVMQCDAAARRDCPLKQMQESRRRASAVIRSHDRFLGVRVDPMTDEEGKILGAVHIVSDITERMRAEEELHKTNQSLSALIQSSPLAITTVDNEGHVLMWNKQAERMFGWTADEVIGAFLPMVPPEGIPESDAFRERILLGETVTGVEFVRRRKGGAELHINLSAAPLRDSNGRIYGIISAIADITEHKRSRQILRQREDEIQHLLKMEAIGRLAGGIAHDFNNILTSVIGYNDILLKKLPADSPFRAYPENISRAAERAVSLSRHLLAFSRRQVCRPQVLDLGSAIDEAYTMLKPLIGENIEVCVKIAKDLGRVRGDPVQIQQVIINLAVNAKDAIAQEGKITIEARNMEIDESYTGLHVGTTAGPHVAVSVSDDGCGMDDAVKEHLFEPFFTTKPTGTGLGLSTAYGIITQAGGHFSVQSEKGKGSTIMILLPRIFEAPEETKPPEAHQAGPGKAETILTVEDQEDVRKLVVEILSQDGYKVLEAPNGMDALTIARSYSEEIHLLLTDLVMPQMGGRELYKHLRELRPGIKVLLMSGYTESIQDQRDILESGVSFLEKPFTPAILESKVREILDS